MPHKRRPENSLTLAEVRDVSTLAKTFGRIELVDGGLKFSEQPARNPGRLDEGPASSATTRPLQTGEAARRFPSCRLGACRTRRSQAKIEADSRATSKIFQELDALN